MKKILLYTLSTLVSLGLFAEKSVNYTTSSSSNTNKTNIGTCSPSSAQVDLDINNIRARILGAGDFWWDGVTTAKYQYPKIDQTTGQIERNVLFAGALWFTGLDEAGALRCSSQTFRNQGHDFWTGPLGNGGDIPDDVCSNYDIHFEVRGKSITEFLGEFQANNGAISEEQIPDDVKYWPGRGNPFLLNDPTRNVWYYDDGSLAPFLDADGDGIYNPMKGDYPVVRVFQNTLTGLDEGAFADQMIFWVINDFGNSHGRTNGTPIGVQVNCLAFAYQTSDEINDMTFYTYEIIKKTSGILNETFMGVFVDPDLGGAQDDFVGCDTVRSIGFCYNADNDDVIYGAGPPIVAIDYFEGPLDDNGNELGLSSFSYFINGGSQDLSDPDQAAQFRNIQIGLTTLGNPLTDEGDGTPGTGSVTKYAFPGNPADNTQWSECQMPNVPEDRRFVQNSGPFTLSSAQTQRISIGVMVVTTDPEIYSGCPDIEDLVGVADDKAQFLFDNNFGIVDGPDAPSLKIRELSNKLAINLINDPSTSNNYGEIYNIVAPGAPSGASDTAYNFEGYIVYQLRDNQVTARDLIDPSKAKIIFQSDRKNGVSKVFNYEDDPISGTIIPVLKAEGNDEGISRSFEITDDAFADGETQLINYKPYYFAAISYAYNNFTQFEQLDSNNASAQRIQYLQGRRNFNIYSAVPHDISSELSGTILNAEFGQGVNVQRIEGQGNGGNNISISDESRDAILRDGSVDILEYEPLFDPLGFKIVDPLSVQNVDFELRFKNDSSNTVDQFAYWEMYVSKDNQIIDTVRSTISLNRPFNQVIEEYGISLNVGQPIPISTNLDNGASIYDYKTSSIEFAEPSRVWLSFLQDGSNGGDISPSNWIRTGDFTNTTYLANIFDSYSYSSSSEFVDQNGIFANIVDGGFAPYCLTSNYKKDAVVQDPDAVPLGSITTPNSVYGPAFLWDEYNVAMTDEVASPEVTLENLQSVDIIMTSNKDFWSKCIVFETGEDNNATVGNMNKGQIRNQNSVDKNGNVSGSDIGYSYFPGYAINVETGERLNIAFGESSDRVDNNGNDMLWNPTSKLNDLLTNIPNTTTRVPVFGGKHFIYVFASKYDECQQIHDVLVDPSNMNNTSIPTAVQDVYKDIMYTSVPYLAPGFELNGIDEGIIPNDVNIKIRIERPFEKYHTSETNTTETNDSLPRYRFSTVGLAPETNVEEVSENYLDNIRVVPNPYYAYSSYEVSPNSNVVKITNLPDDCTISIYTMDGKLVRKFNRSVGTNGNSESTRQDVSLGQIVGTGNIDNSISWNLKNHKDIPVSSGVYMIYISAPGIGETVVKSAVFVRPPDVTNF